jgi:hypothetical protein
MGTEQAQPRTSIINKDQAIVVRSSDGSKIRRIKTRRQLSVEDGTLVKIINAKKAWKDKPAQPPVLIPTANGYMQLAAGSGVSLEHPDTVIVDGKEQPNGFKDSTGTYYFRAKAGGYTDLGQPFITDRTVDYNVHRYNIQDLLSKAKYSENAKYFKVLPFRGKTPDGALKGEPKEGDWAGYQIDSATVLWVDCSCPQFFDWLSEMNNREKNAIRTCQTFADRNAIAAHPSLPAKKKFETVTAVVDCVSWFAEQGTVTFKQLMEHGNVVLDTAGAVSIDQDPEAGKIIDAELAAVPTEAGDVPDRDDEEEDDDIPMDDDRPPDREPEGIEPTRPPKQAKAKAAPKAEAKAAPAKVDNSALIKKIEALAEAKSVSYHKARAAMGIDDAEALEMMDTARLEELYKLVKMA